MTHPYYLHPAGHPSRWGVLDVGLKCVHECGFCFYLYMDGSNDPTSGMRHAKFHSRDHVIGLVDALADNGFLGFDITGGEPALHPNIVDIVARATERGIASRIITLGQFLGRHMHGLSEPLRDSLLAAGLTDLRLSVHEVEDPQFKALTGGSWAKQLDNMNWLDARGFQYMTNTTINQKNYKRLPLIAKEIARHNVYNSTLLFMMAHYQWSKNGHAQEIQSRYTDAAKYAREYVDILEAAKIGVVVRYAPLCTIAGLERNHVGAVGVRYDPHEWMNAMDHKLLPGDANQASPSKLAERYNLRAGEPSDGLNLLLGEGALAGHKLVAGRGHAQGVQKVFPAQCAGCSAMPVCDGVEPQYVERFGGGEFVPYVGVNRGNVIDAERLAYRPAHFVKLEPDADIRAAVSRAFSPVALPHNPKVSIVVTCYNYGRYLADCLDSVKAQTYSNIELIVVDDKSTDDSAEIASLWLGNNAARFPANGAALYVMGKNFGQPAGPRNYGVSRSSGQLVMCLDADDQLTPTYVEECVQALIKNPDASIAYTGVQCFGDSDQKWGAPPFSYEQLIMQNFITCASMYRREVWDEVGGYMSNHRGVEDYAFWVEAAGLGYRGVPVPRLLWKYRVHGDGIFQSDVVPNFEAKYRQIVLNNQALYPPNMVAAAKAGRDVPRAVD